MSRNVANMHVLPKTFENIQFCLILPVPLSIDVASFDCLILQKNFIQLMVNVKRTIKQHSARKRRLKQYVCPSNDFVLPHASRFLTAPNEFSTGGKI